MTLPDLTLLRPLWLLGLLAVAAFGLWLWRRQGALGDWTRAADRDLLAAMARLGRVDEGGSHRSLWLILLAAIVTALALTGIAMERRDTRSFRNLDGAIFVIDASPSVTGSEIWTDLVTLGRFGLGALGTRPGGIVVYAGDAYVATDMTLDHLQLGQTLSLIGPDTVPDPGSRPERALDLAAGMLTDAQVIAGDVFLFTDGGGLGPASLVAAERIAGQGARLSVVPVGDETPAMAAHAALAGGQVFSLRDVEGLARFLGEDARTRLQAQEMPLLFWRDIGRYLLILALVPVALLFRRDAA